MNSKSELNTAAVPEPPPERDPFARDEMNLAEFPITLLTDRAPAGMTMLTREVQARDERTGMLVTRKVTVTGSDAYGIPTAQDNLVLLGLIYLTKRANNFRDRKVWFTRSELIKVLEWPDTGPSYARVHKSFCRWGNVFVLYENSWWEKSSRAYTSDKGFGIIDNFELNDSRSKQINLFKSNFAWNEVFFESLEAGFVRSIDLKTLLRLRHPSSQQMFRYLGKHFYRSPTLTLNLRTFACEHIGLDRGYKDNGKLKEKLQPALEELEAIGFLEPMSRDERYTKLGRGEWTIKLVRKAEAPPEVDEELPSPEQETSPARPSLETALIERGISSVTASELLRTFPAEQIEAKIEVFDWMVSKKDKRVSKNPGGYLAESIRKNYSTPKGFETQTERTQRLAAETEQRRKVEAAKSQAAADQQAREQAERGRIQGHWDSLSPAAQEQLWTEALANPSLLFMAQMFRRSQNNPEGSARYRQMLLDAHIMGLLDEAKAGPTPAEPTR